MILLFQKFLEAITESQWILQLPVVHIFCYSAIDTKEFIDRPDNATSLLGANQEWDLSHEKEFLTDDLFEVMREKRKQPTHPNIFSLNNFFYNSPSHLQL